MASLEIQKKNDKVNYDDHQINTVKTVKEKIEEFEINKRVKLYYVNF